MADKLIVVSALTVLVAQHSTAWLTLPSLIIIGREIMISALREWMAEMNSSVTVAVSRLGKIKTSLQMVAIAVLLALPPNFDSVFIVAGYSLLYVAAMMTLWSMSIYLQAAWPTLKQGLATASETKKVNERG